MFQRILKLPPRGSCFLLGPRQTGKSTLVRANLSADAWTVDLLEHDTFMRFVRDPSQFRREAEAKIKAGVRTIFVDEVQKIPELLDEVHGLIERHGARFILTGSSARKLRRRGTNLLGGRAATRHLHPLVHAEMGTRFDLDRVMRLGSLPPVVTASEENARDILRGYADTYLREEIQAEALVRNLGGFSRFLDVAAAQSGELLSVSSVSRDAGVAVRTVQEYFQILEDTLVGIRLEPWRKSPRARLVAHPKFYLFDTGVVNVLCRRLGAEIDPTLRGRLFEHFVVLECVRAIDNFGSEARAFFWRTNHGAEVDLLIERHGKPRLAVEIKARSKISGADLSGLRSFAEQHPRVPRVLVCLAREEFELDGVRILPFTKFLGEIRDVLLGQA
jgi:predicted AAA+ superfamily ATPase